MRSLEPKHRLQGYSLPEIVMAYEASIARRSLSFTFNGNKLKPGPALDAIVLDFLMKTEDEQDQILLRGITRLEYLCAQDKPASEVVPPTGNGDQHHDPFMPRAHVHDDVEYREPVVSRKGRPRRQG